jgi:hypothetical protein
MPTSILEQANAVMTEVQGELDAEISVSVVQSGPVFDLFARTEDRTTGPVRSLGWHRTGPLPDQDCGPVLVRDRSFSEFKKHELRDAE